MIGRDRPGRRLTEAAYKIHTQTPSPLLRRAGDGADIVEAGFGGVVKIATDIKLHDPGPGAGAEDGHLGRAVAVEVGGGGRPGDAQSRQRQEAASQRDRDALTGDSYSRLPP